MQEMNEYDKALQVMRNRFKKNCSRLYDHVYIKSFMVDDLHCIKAVFQDGLLYVSTNYLVTAKNRSQHPSTKDIIDTLFDYAKCNDIFVGLLMPIKILSKNETLEKIAIEYDMSLNV